MSASDTVRIATAGDVHVHEGDPDAPRRAFAALAGTVDCVLLAGDLTTHGEPAQAAVLAAACREVDAPVYAVLGNHDWHADRGEEVMAVLREEGGVTVLERSTAVCPTAAGCDVGIVGLKGFIGGFPGSHLPDFGEPQLRAVYATTTDDVAALDSGLREVALAPIRVVLLHYAPTEETLAGEPPGIFGYLGSDRLAAPIREHEPDLVLHGHAHAGRFDGRIGNVAVHNVSIHVLGRPFYVFELPARDRAPGALH